MSFDKVNFRKSIDPSDPGFEIPGYKLRWVSGMVSENSPGRPWRVLKKEMFTADAIRKIEDHIYGAFFNGDTIRRGDTVLTYCPEEIARKLRADLDAKANEQLRRTEPSQYDRKGKKVFEEKVSDEAVNLVDKFKKNRN